MNLLRLSLLAGACFLSSFSVSAAQLWITTSDQKQLLDTAPDRVASLSRADPNLAAIVVDESRAFQTVEGFGFALTGGSAQHLIHMSADARAALLRQLFSPEGDGFGFSYLRVSIGASDLNERVFSYSDVPEGKSDFELNGFYLGEDLTNVVPVLKEILAINPGMKILGSPWSAPTWMKTNGRVQGGKLRLDCYDVYARYFVKYLKAMANEGIIIDAITPQNEPLNDLNTPSMQFFAKEEAAFVRDHLGPQLTKAGLKTKIIIYDHNCDAPEYPLSILNDPEARRFVEGSGFHLYAGDTGAMSRVRDAFPEKGLYFTEMMATNRGKEFDVAGPVSRILIGATRNWSRNVILWNLAADAQFKPHTDNGGCAMCQGAVTIEGNQVTKNVACYVIGHASKFVPPGSSRISSTSTPALPNVAFGRVDGKKALVVANPDATEQAFQVLDGSTMLRAVLPARAVGTLVW